MELKYAVLPWNLVWHLFFYLSVITLLPEALLLDGISYISSSRVSVSSSQNYFVLVVQTFLLFISNVSSNTVEMDDGEHY